MISVFQHPSMPDRIAITAPFSHKDVLKSIPGRRWDPNERVWHYPATSGSARNIMQSLGVDNTDDAFKALLEVADKEDDGQQVKHLDDEQLEEIPGRLPAWLHQKRAYHFALGRAGSMLAMDMGTGKSRATVSLLDGWEADTALILAPRSVLNVWPNQFEIHSERTWWPIVGYHPRKTVAARRKEIEKQLRAGRARQLPVALMLNYEAFWRAGMIDLLKDILDGDWSGSGPAVLVLDESHRIKSPGGKASQAAQRLSPHADRRLALTGTPMPHSPLDVYAQYRAIDPGIFGTSFTLFRSKYAVMGGFEGRQVIGYQNQAELTSLFGGAAFIVKKEDAGLDLPPTLHEQIPVELAPATMRQYNELEEGFITEVSDGYVTIDNALVKLLRLQQVTSGFVRNDDGDDIQLGNEKEQALEDLLEDLPEGEPVVVFCRFHHDLDTVINVASKFKRRYGEISGRVKPGKELWALNERSQLNEHMDLIGVQLQSGGVGIDLTRAAYAVYLSMGFNLGDYLQSLARLDRPGQTRSVTYFHIVAKDTVDEQVYKALSKREQVVDSVIAAAKSRGADA